MRDNVTTIEDNIDGIWIKNPFNKGVSNNVREIFTLGTFEDYIIPLVDLRHYENLIKWFKW